MMLLINSRCGSAVEENALLQRERVGGGLE